MSNAEYFIELMHVDPETLPGAPTNEQIADSLNRSNPPALKLQRDINPGERVGFLEMWRANYIRDYLASTGTDELEDIANDTAAELAKLAPIEQRIHDLRFINTIARNMTEKPSPIQMEQIS